MATPCAPFPCPLLAGRPLEAFTTRVRPAPNLPLRAMVALPPPPGTPPSGSCFTLMTYNLLADLYAKVGEGVGGCGWGVRTIGLVIGEGAGQSYNDASLNIWSWQAYTNRTVGRISSSH